ncbi:dTDP-4-dehydrorhamnose reductase [Allobranchiibius sp. GilTou73]|uniref:dTDP-4-dehydrorhamnose reductase n=1 Tax=Allobranchiibius sp. GilTou73 TaxID=2904523 RepID=UPI001F32B650|nr:dTDP-4-dehydrorhamnose reductase [Allobranchiibius sp. GilTou73]UIJ36362.1 dTDP-4-dehydrorhamnose reductase [Allobranchiibius sp. GilTou73]
MKRWLLTGGRGMLGQDLARVVERSGDQVLVTGSADLDITDAQAVQDAVGDVDVVVNCAAWTAVDDAETHEAQAFSINATGAANVARACAQRGVRLVQISTDYVFDGTATTPYAEDTTQRPRSAYGRTKCAGEWAVRSLHPDALVVRTAWLYGAGGGNFVATMARLAGERDMLTVVDDQRGQPTWTVDLADLVVRLVDAGVPGGYWHGVGAGETTWWGLARAVFEEAGWDPERVQAVGSDQFVRPAPRPAYSVLGTGRLTEHGVSPVRDWADALREALPELLA